MTQATAVASGPRAAVLMTFLVDAAIAARVAVGKAVAATVADAAVPAAAAGRVLAMAIVEADPEVAAEGVTPSAEPESAPCGAVSIGEVAGMEVTTAAATVEAIVGGPRSRASTRWGGGNCRESLAAPRHMSS